MQVVYFKLKGVECFQNQKVYVAYSNFLNE